ncbi:MAG: DNA-binding response regulator [Bacteroidetes bacterium HGW-Bacteroidetes-2]|jgi:two-component system LytT family response regulator|nr:MAG: DNA-binding response regulator [Bacteroidetes bacterium HGW-Bacteroidetes-2]
MIKALIIEDEQHCIDRLILLLQPYLNITILGTFLTVETGKNGIKTLQPDLVFLDIQIHQKTGFDLLKSFQHINFQVIFTTAYDAYAVQAFKFSAIDYLLKPIDEEDLNNAILKVSNTLSQNNLSEKMNVLLSNILQKDNLKKISITSQEGILFIPVAEIIRCQADINYTHIFLTSKKKITVSKTLKYFEELLVNCNFFRVHNSHLINLNFVVKFSKTNGGEITMQDKSTIEVSSRRKEAFLKRI